MESFAEVLEQELEDAVEIKNKKSLHRYILLLADNLVREDRFERNIGELKSEVKVIAESVKQGFAHMDKRFEAMDKRFEDMNQSFTRRFDDVNKRFDDVNMRFEDVNKRFEDVNERFEYVNKRFDDTNVRFGDMNKRFSAMFTYMNIAMSILVVITVLFKFL